MHITYVLPSYNLATKKSTLRYRLACWRGDQPVGIVMTMVTSSEVALTF